MAHSGRPPESYYRHSRIEAWASVPVGARRILDVGCGAGYALEWLRSERGATWLEGIELDPAAANAAQQRANRVTCGDAELVVSGLESQFYDAILCLDSLEHMRDPWRVTRELTRALRPGGTLVACVPNVRHWRVTWPLVVRGVWQYEDEGLLDRTHLRFFTRKSAIELVQQPGMRLRSIAALGLEPGARARWLASLSLGMLRPFLEFQYLIVANKADA